MLNEKQERELAYLVIVDDIVPIEGADNVETAIVGGWHIMVKKEQFHKGDIGIYFEIDSKVPEKEPFMFLAKKHFKVKTQKYFKGTVISQGLLMHPEDFDWKDATVVSANYSGAGVVDKSGTLHKVNDESRFVTKLLGVTYASDEDNKRKGNGVDKYKKMAQRRPDLFKKSWARWMMHRDWGKKVMFFFFGKKRDKKGGWPVGKFPGVSKTDQERCENMLWILEDKTPFIKTQKCDGSSGTYILERLKHGKFEFYVCSRNVRMADESQECWYGSHNYYWEVAKKYDIENKMKDYLFKNPDISFVCWQGEICAPGIQKNPHKLKETHFYCFHMTDSKHGRWDIREAEKIWKNYNMEVVPIIDKNYILPDDFEEFKLDADGFYAPEVCEGESHCRREGFVYYKTNDTTFSFKNVSRKYLLKQNGQ